MIVALFALSLSANEKRPHHVSSRGSKRSRDPGRNPPFEEYPVERYDDILEQQPQTKVQKKKSSTQREKRETIKNQQIPHTIVLPNGQLACESGYTSGLNITSVGCWKCYVPCQKQEICTYPGVCNTPTPLIVGIQQLDKKSNIRVNYVVDSATFLPEVAYCKINDQIQKAPFVTNRMVPCSPIDEKIKTLMISFDESTWSSPVMNPVIMKSIPSKKIFFFFALTTVIIIVVAAVFYISRSRSRNLRLPARREARQIARFPQAANEEVVYTNKQPY
jgi:hypothetical protein